MSNSVILLTACINPNGMAYTVLQDQNIRLQQYKEALSWYIENTSAQIVFTENTGYDISPLFKKHVDSGRLEVLTFYGNDYDKDMGKGYGESLIIEYAIGHSQILKANNNIKIVKVTGRLICYDIQKMLNAYTNDDTIYASTKVDFERKFELNSQVFVAPVLFWKKYFLPFKENLSDSKMYWFEHLLYDTSRNWKRDGHFFKEMWIPIALEGISGSTGIQIKSTSLSKRAIFYIHYILHRIGYYGSLAFWKA